MDDNLEKEDPYTKINDEVLRLAAETGKVLRDVSLFSDSSNKKENSNLTGYDATSDFYETDDNKNI